MGLTASSRGGDFRPAPEGTHLARCVRVIDLGTQPGGGQFPKPRHRCIFAWELPGELEDVEGEMMPMLAFKNYTLSLSDRATLRHDLESWRGRKFTAEELTGFQLRKVLGAPCMITIVHSDDGQYANIQAVTAVPKGTHVEAAVHPLVYYEIEDGENNVFQGLSENLQAKIKSAPEWRAGRPDVAPGSFDDDDDIPF